MSDEKPNGHNTVTVEMVEILREIRSDVKGTNERLDALTREVRDFKTEVREDLGAIRADVTSIKNDLHDLRQGVMLDKEDVVARLAKLEAAVFKPPAPARRARRGAGR